MPRHLAVLVAAVPTEPGSIWGVEGTLVPEVRIGEVEGDLK